MPPERRKGVTPIDVLVPSALTTARSSCIFFDTGTTVKNVQSAAIIATYIGNITFYLGLSSTITGTIIWEEVNNREEHVFASPNRALFWRADGEGGAEITIFKIKYKTNIS